MKLFSCLHAHKVTDTPPSNTEPTVEEMKEISSEELKRMRNANEKVVLVDVRTKRETDEGIIPGAILIPLPELEDRLEELRQQLNDQSTLIVNCRSGARSAQAIKYLRTQGITKGINLKGGILGWELLLQNSNEEMVPSSWTVDDLRNSQKAGDNILIVDVRNEEETDQGTIPGAVLIPLSKVCDRVDYFHAHFVSPVKLLIYCHSGRRSQSAIDLLKTKGIVNAINLEGGYIAWVESSK